MHSNPIILDQAASLRRIATHQRNVERVQRPHVVTVTSGKGGVGKSTVALNLAIKLSEMGQKVLLVDADANLGNIDLMLGISPKWRLGNVLRNEIEVEDALVNPLPRMKLLAGSSGEAEYPQIELERQSWLIHELAHTEERFDLVMIDTAAGLNKDIVHFAVHSDEVLVVTNAEPTSVMDAYAVMKMVWAGNPETRLGFVMNGVRVPPQADEAAEKLQMALKHFLRTSAHYLGSIPFDEAVSSAIVQQRPVLHVYPHSAAALSIQSFAHAFLFHSAAQRNAGRIDQR
jgi:flagellar biosynthesis protein FlhG